MNIEKPDKSPDYQKLISKIDFSSPLTRFIIPDVGLTQDKQPIGQIQAWRESAKNSGNLVQVSMNEEQTGKIKEGANVFYTNGLHGCVVYLSLDSEGNYGFGHIDTVKAAQRLTEWQDIAESGQGILLVPDIPEFESLEGGNVTKYKLTTDFIPDSFAEGMALQESPDLQSACIFLKRETDGGFSGYINAFERTYNAKWHLPYLPSHIASKIELK
ncbi:MAG: hypothetical protein ACOCXT_02105 [Candidatus Dojkabacteria bacterium]